MGNLNRELVPAEAGWLTGNSAPRLRARRDGLAPYNKALRLIPRGLGVSASLRAYMSRSGRRSGGETRNDKRSQLARAAHDWGLRIGSRGGMECRRVLMSNEPNLGHHGGTKNTEVIVNAMKERD